MPVICQGTHARCTYAAVFFFSGAMSHRVAPSTLLGILEAACKLSIAENDNLRILLSRFSCLAPMECGEGAS